MEKLDESKIWLDFQERNRRTLARLKDKSNRIISAKITCVSDTYRFFQLIFDEIGLNLEYTDDSTMWEEELKKYHHKCATQKLSIYEAETVSSIIDKLCRCETFLNRNSIRMAFYNIRREYENNQPTVSYMSGDEEAALCNRQFRSIMEDNDAWGNID